MGIAYFLYISSVQDWLIIGVVVMVLFGGGKIPEFAKGLGEGIRELKKGLNGDPEAPGGLKPPAE